MRAILKENHSAFLLIEVSKPVEQVHWFVDFFAMPLYSCLYMSYSLKINKKVDISADCEI